MSIDLDKHRDSILKAFNDVVSDRKPEDWALFGYEGQSNVLKVVGTGEDGLEELADDLNSSKIMYAVVKVLDPNTTRPKIVLINWQGEGAPTVRKGTCARHLQDIRRVLQGIHVTVNARMEEEVEPEVVMAAVLKASASSYNFSERSEMGEKTTPVGTNYRRTNPLTEIDSRSRNKFWEQQEEEERLRKEEEQQRKEEEQRRLEKERKQREISEAQHREQLTKERNSRIAAERRAEEAAARHLSAAEQQRWQQDVAREQQEEEEERSRRAEVMRQQRKKEAEALIGGRTHAARDKFEQHSTATASTTAHGTNRPPPRRIKEFNPVNKEPSEENKAAQETQLQSTVPSRGVAARWPPVASAVSPQLPSPAHRRAVGATSHTPIQDMIPTQSSPPAPPSKQSLPSDTPHTPQSQPQEAGRSYVRNLLKEGLPQRPKEEEEEEETWGEDDEKDIATNTPSSTVISATSSTSQLLSAQPYVPSTPAHTHSINNKNLDMYTSKNNSGYKPPPLPSSSSSSSVPPPQVEEKEESHHLPHQSVQSRFGGENGGGSYTNGLHQSELRNGVMSSPTRQNTTTTHHHHYHQHPTTTTTTTAAATTTGSTTTTAGQSVLTANQNAGIENSAGMLYEVDGVEYQILPEHGLCARALYDYQAADDTEITFDPSEIITNIDQIDEGWWQGVGPDGMYGLFPANYVELINDGLGGGGGGGGGGGV